MRAHAAKREGGGAGNAKKKGAELEMQKEAGLLLPLKLMNKNKQTRLILAIAFLRHLFVITAVQFDCKYLSMFKVLLYFLHRVSFSLRQK